MKLKCLFLFLFVILSGCAVEPHPDYRPGEDAPTHDKMFEEIFGIPPESSSPFEIFASAEPHELLAGGLTLLWVMAVTAFIVIILTNALKATINAPHSNTLLGNDINTPVAPVRIGLTFFLLLILPGGNHYSMIESIVLSVNKYFSSHANNLYISNAQIAKTDPLDVKPEMTSLAISRETAYRVFSMAMCKYFLVDKGLDSEFSASSFTADKEYESGSTFSYAKGYRYTVELSEYFWSRDEPIEGGCGQWYVYANPPGGIKIKDPEAPFASFTLFDDPDSINSVISARLSMMMNQIYLFTDMQLYRPYYQLAQEMVEYQQSSDKDPNDGKAEEFRKRFNTVLNEYNSKLTTIARYNISQVLSDGLVEQLNRGVIDTGIEHGWFFAGALPFMFATSADRILVFEKVKLNTSVPMPNAFVERYRDDMKVYLGYGASILDSYSSSHNSGMLPQDNVDAGFWGTYAECVFFDNHGSIFDCVGTAITIDTLGLVRALSANVSNPLTLVHQVGLSGAENVLETLIAFQAAHAVVAGTAGFFDFIPGLGGATAGTLMSIADNTLSQISPILNFLSVTFVVMAYFIILLPFLYFSVAVVSYLIQLFVGVLGANFFAVSHAWLEGQGFVSSYAQRGYPSLLFSALTPLLIVIVFFIYLFIQPFVFQFLGYTYGLFLSNFVGNEEPSLYGGIFFLVVLLALMIVLHRIVAKLILEIPDRTMRLIGVHEALSSNDFSMQVEQMGNQGVDNTVNSASRGISSAGQGVVGNQDREGGTSVNNSGQGYVDRDGNDVPASEAGNKAQGPEAHNRETAEKDNSNNRNINSGDDNRSENGFNSNESSGFNSRGESGNQDQPSSSNNSSQASSGSDVAPYDKVEASPNATGLTAVGNRISAKIQTAKNKSDAVASLNERTEPKSNSEDVSSKQEDKSVEDAMNNSRKLREEASVDKDKLNVQESGDQRNYDEGPGFNDESEGNVDASSSEMGESKNRKSNDDKNSDDSGENDKN